MNPKIGIIMGGIAIGLGGMLSGYMLALPPSIQGVIQKTRHAVVEIQGNHSIGSGIIWKQKGREYIVTNAHVLNGNTKWTVFFSNGEKTSAEIWKVDQSDDLASLIFPNQKKKNHSFFQENQLNSNSSLFLGETVYAEGYPLQIGFTVTKGIISGIGKTFKTKNQDYTNLVQTDAQLSVGNSGGPLITSTGKLVGINTFVIKNGNGLGFAISASLLKEKLKKVI